MGVELLHKEFKNLNVFITGVSSGIGYAVTKAYDLRGANVFGIDINKMQDHKLLSKRFTFFKCEVENYKKMNDVVKKIIRKKKE